jgi:hypothetical protein
VAGDTSKFGVSGGRESGPIDEKGDCFPFLRHRRRPLSVAHQTVAIRLGNGTERGKSDDQENETETGHKSTCGAQIEHVWSWLSFQKVVEKAQSMGVNPYAKKNQSYLLKFATTEVLGRLSFLFLR